MTIEEIRQRQADLNECVILSREEAEQIRMVLHSAQHMVFTSAHVFEVRQAIQILNNVLNKERK